MASTYSLSDYYLFGSPMYGRSFNSNSYKFGFNSQMKENEIYGEGNTYSAEYWMYDSRLGRRWNVDLKPNPSISWYSTFAGNPIWYSDPMGDTLALFKPDGSFWKFEDDGKEEWSGRYYQTETVTKTESKGVQTVTATYSDAIDFSFADPVNDVEAIKFGDINKIVFVSSQEVTDMIEGQGALSWYNFGNITKMSSSSRGGEDFDYSYSVIPKKYGSEGASDYPMSRPSPLLFIVEGSGVAQNHMNFGNFLWGATGYSMGYGLTTLKTAAHLNSKMGRGNGYKSQWDSPDDQFSISLGYRFGMKQGYNSWLRAARDMLTR